jgi:hypothetical protein
MSSLDSQILTGLGLRSPRIPLRGRVSQVGSLETSAFEDSYLVGVEVFLR